MATIYIEKLNVEVVPLYQIIAKIFLNLYSILPRIEFDSIIIYFSEKVNSFLHYFFISVDSSLHSIKFDLLVIISKLVPPLDSIDIGCFLYFKQLHNLIILRNEPPKTPKIDYFKTVAF